MLGFAGEPSHSQSLRQVLRRTEDSFTAAQAAKSLARLDEQASVTNIENVLTKFAETDHVADIIDALAYFRCPSSLDLLLDILHNCRFRPTECAIIEALGAFLPAERAKQNIMEWLERWHGDNFDPGEQSHAIHTLARYAPLDLIDQANTVYDMGRLYKSTRRSLAQWLPSLVKHVGIDDPALIALTKRLVCDKEFTVRELAAEALGRIDETFCCQLYEALYSSPNEWIRACAVRTLGFWGEHEAILQEHRYAEAFYTRYFADIALAQSAKRCALDGLVPGYRSKDGLTRLSSYLAIQQQGENSTIRLLDSSISETDIAHTFLRQLSSDVQKRVEKERDEHAQKEEKILGSIGVVYYDL